MCLYEHVFNYSSWICMSLSGCTCIIVPLWCLYRCKCEHQCVLSWMFVWKCASLCLRPESKAPHLETALERRVIDKYWPPSSSNQTTIASDQADRVDTHLSVCFILSCTHRHACTLTHTLQMYILSFSALLCSANTHTWYIALIYWKAKHHWTLICYS